MTRDRKIIELAEFVVITEAKAEDEWEYLHGIIRFLPIRGGNPLVINGDACLKKLRDRLNEMYPAESVTP